MNIVRSQRQGLEEMTRGSHRNISTPLPAINLHVRGGYVIPWQHPANTTVFSRKNDMGLIVALSDSHRASGSMFWDDGESFGILPTKLDTTPTTKKISRYFSLSYFFTTETFENDEYLLTRFECRDVRNPQPLTFLSAIRFLQARDTWLVFHFQNTLTIRKEMDGFSGEGLIFDEVDLFGLVRSVASVTVNGAEHTQFDYDSATQVQTGCVNYTKSK